MPEGTKAPKCEQMYACMWISQSLRPPRNLGICRNYLELTEVLIGDDTAVAAAVALVAAVATGHACLPSTSRSRT